VAVLEVLTEMIRPVKLLRWVALAELVNTLKMQIAFLDIFLGRISRHDAAVEGACAGTAAWAKEVLSAVPTGVGFTWAVGGVVKRPIVAWQRGAGPGMASYMQRILMALCFVFVLEAVATIVTLILLLRLVCTARLVSKLSNE
jgi:hypothetical protein